MLACLLQEQQVQNSESQHQELAKFEAEMARADMILLTKVMGLQKQAGLVAERIMAMKSQINSDDLPLLPDWEAETWLHQSHETRKQALLMRENMNKTIMSAVQNFENTLQQVTNALTERESTLAVKSNSDDRTPVPAKKPQLPPPLPKAAPAKTHLRLERRKLERKSLQVVVDYNNDNTFYTGMSEDISQGGLFIATVDLLPLNTMVDLTFSLPDGTHLQTKGAVRWKRDWDDRTPELHPGMGVQFMDITLQQQQIITRFTQHKEPLFYVD